MYNRNRYSRSRRMMNDKEESLILKRIALHNQNERLR